MPELPILTTELTLQLERHIAPLESANDNLGNDQIVRFGRTIACEHRGAWPPSKVFCFNGEDVALLDEILAFFGDVEPIFYLAHGGFTPAVAEALTAAGFCMCDWTQTILYGLPAAGAATLPPGVTIELVNPATIEAAAEVAAEANGWAQPWREGAKDGVRQSIHREHFQLFLARYRGEPAGIGDFSRSRASEKWCGLGAGGVIPRFRNRGIHTALLRHRLHAAFTTGYELVISGAKFGSTSFHNQQRVGLRLGYIETAWRRSPTLQA
jgi:GNAT superfamily N-acetyltransferase